MRRVRCRRSSTGGSRTRLRNKKIALDRRERVRRRLSSLRGAQYNASRSLGSDGGCFFRHRSVTGRDRSGSRWTRFGSRRTVRLCCRMRRRQRSGLLPSERLRRVRRSRALVSSVRSRRGFGASRDEGTRGNATQGPKTVGGDIRLVARARSMFRRIDRTLVVCAGAWPMRLVPRSRARRLASLPREASEYAGESSAFRTI